MVIKRTIPTWSVVVTIVVVLGGAAGFLLMSNPTLDKATLIKLRTKPNSARSASVPTGLPRGTPIEHALPGPAAGSRQKPTG
jgi:hypothetical protein